MRLFDEIDRTDLGAQDFQERVSDYINRSALPEISEVRDIVERWFTYYPEPKQAALRARIRSDNLNFQSAYFELLLFTLLRKLEYGVEVEPSLSGTERIPDFLAYTPDGESFVLEGTLATDRSVAQIAADKRKAVVFDALNRIRSPNFSLNISENGSPNSPPAVGPVRNDIEKRLATLDPDELLHLVESSSSPLETLPSWEYNLNGWRLTIWPIPKSREERRQQERVIVEMWGGATWVAPHDALRRAVEGKARRYGPLDRPFFVAVSLVGPWDGKLLDRFALNALIGPEVITFLIDQDGSSRASGLSRAADSAWLNDGKLQNTRLSGVLVFSGLTPWNLKPAIVRLYHNPWASRPCQSALRELPQAVPIEDRYEFKKGRRLSEILA